MLPTFCVTVSPNFSQIDISVIEINSVLGIGVSLSKYIYRYLYIYRYIFPKIDLENGVTKKGEGVLE